MWRGFVGVAVILAASVLSGCASISIPKLAQAAPAPLNVETVFVASTRGETATKYAPLSFASYEISVPPSHRPGNQPRDISDGSNPRTEFLQIAEQRFDTARSFTRELGAEARAAGKGSGEVLVFVHGFNTTLNESLARLAQLSTDFNLSAAPLLYAWPSDRRISAYEADTERAVEASKGLRTLIRELVAAGTGRVILVGYSMGAATVLHALGEMQAAGEAGSFAKLDVVLLSPDVDLDSLRKLSTAKLPRPLVVFGSRDDLPLKLVSALAHKGRPRLGALSNPSLLSEIELTYVDVANVRHTGFGHIAVGDTPALIAAINAMPRPDLAVFATGLAAEIPGASVTRHGRMTYVTLPEMGL